MNHKMTNIIGGASGAVPIFICNGNDKDDVERIALISVTRREYPNSGFLKKTKDYDGNRGQQIIMYVNGNKLLDERYFIEGQEIIKRRFVRNSKDLNTLLLHLRDINIIKDYRELYALKKHSDVLPIITMTSTPYITMINQFMDSITFDTIYSESSDVINACLDELKRIFLCEIGIIKSLPSKMVLIDEYYEGELKTQFLSEDIAFLKSAIGEKKGFGISLPIEQNQMFRGFGLYHVESFNEVMSDAIYIVTPTFGGDRCIFFGDTKEVFGETHIGIIER